MTEPVALSAKAEQRGPKRLVGGKDPPLILGMGAGLVCQQEAGSRHHAAGTGRQRRTGVVGRGDSAGEQHRTPTGDFERLRPERRRRCAAGEVSARLVSLRDQAVGAPDDCAARLIDRADHHEHEDAVLGEPFQQCPIDAKSHDGDVDSRFHARIDMAAADERHQQVHRDRTVGGGVADLADRLAQLGHRCETKGAKAAGPRDRRGQLRARQATAHARLGDRDF
jgi:hypothetical protein